MNSQQTPAFRAWFGSSQVTDADGPMVVFHGTAVQGTTFDTPIGSLPRGAFTEFAHHYLGAVSDTSDSRIGFWFTADRGRARNAAHDATACMHGDSAYIYEVFLRIERPFVIPDVRTLAPEEVVSLAAQARASGHDGLIFRKGEGSQPDFVVFSSNQVKSAVANQGTYDLTNPSICA